MPASSRVLAVAAAAVVLIFVVVSTSYAGFTPTVEVSSPAQDALELEAEVLYRCVLYGQVQELVSIVQAWEPVLDSARILALADREFQRRMFAGYAETIWVMLIITPQSVDPQALMRLSQKTFEAFDFVRAYEEIARVTQSLRELAIKADLALRENDARLRATGSPALNARLPEDCPSSR